MEARMKFRPMILAICAVLAGLPLAGCDWDKSVSVPVISSKAKLMIADPAPLHPGKVQWIVVTEANWDAVVEKIKGRGEIVILYALDGKNFKQQKANDADVIRYVTQVRSNVKAYRRYYEGDGK
jgi:hypothetical protein